ERANFLAPSRRPAVLQDHRRESRVEIAADGLLVRQRPPFRVLSFVGVVYRAYEVAGRCIGRPNRCHEYRARKAANGSSPRHHHVAPVPLSRVLLPHLSSPSIDISALSNAHPPAIMADVLKPTENCNEDHAARRCAARSRPRTSRRYFSLS